MNRIILTLLCLSFSLSAEVLNNSLYLHHHIARIRHQETGRAGFRESLSKIGEYLAITAMEELEKVEVDVQTPLGTASHLSYKEEPVLVTILRAGMPLLEGVQKVFPHAEVGFFAMARDEETFVPFVSYIGVPDVKDKSVFIIDTMVGTAGSVNSAIDYLKQQGAKNITFLCVMITQEGFDNIAPEVKVIAAAVDPILNEKKYIVPGLGDAGDRSYGQKAK